MSQSLPLVDQLKNLELMQELDLKIDSVKKSKSQLPGHLKAIDASLGKINSQLNEKKTAAGEIEKAIRQTQAALDLNKDRLARSQAKLESVQNSQEFQAASKEIEQLRKLALSLEEQAKKSSVDLEATGKEVSVLEGEVEKLKTEKTSQESEVAGQESQFKSDIATLMASRSQYSSQVDARILAQYDRVRGARAGIGIVPAVSGRCKGCNMMVPAQLFNEIQKGLQLHACPSCHRILFVPQPVAEVKAG